MSAPPLVVDLDGTLLNSDTLHESALRVFRGNAFHIVLAGYWLSRGKAVLKQHLAQRADLDITLLPYNQPVVTWLAAERAAGRRLVLCTACDASIAQSVAQHLGLFDEVIASDGQVNLAGDHKAEALERRYGRGGFDYAGNSKADLPVWSRARRGIVVNASSGLLQQARSAAEIERVFEPATVGPGVWRRVLRVHQWLKNFLLFVPLFAAHRLFDPIAWAALVLAFLSFSLCASSVYIANDLLDLESDRRHPRKRQRPFASGQVPILTGVVLAPLLLLLSLAIGWFVEGRFLPWLALYFAITCAYSLGLKRLILVDCLILAMLYTLRIVAGAAAVEMPLSFWLLAFSVFLFLSLAFVKRYAELEVQLLAGKEKVHGRGYYTTDAPLIQTLGIASGYAAVVVLALYLNSDNVMQLYRMPEVVWAAVPVMLFWISWIWMKAHRGLMHDDPLVFAVKDRASLVTGLVFGAVLVIGSLGIR